MKSFVSNSFRSIAFFFILSLILHILLLILFKETLSQLARQATPEKPMWLELKKMRELPHKLVDMEKPLKEETPDKPSAQSLYNQKVKEETVNPLPPTLAQKNLKPEQPQNEPKKKLSEDLYAVKQPAPDPFSQHIPGIPTEGNISSSPFPDDYYPDYKVGNRTYINTLANPNLRYFAELKRKFKLTFNPMPSLRGKINEIARGRIEVVLGLSVNREGNLTDLIVIRSSGLEGYDQEGIRTVRASSPFSAPPAQFITAEGMLHMAWTFIVYL